MPETKEFGSWRCQISIPPKKFTDRKIISFIYFAFLKVYLVVWLLLGFVCQFSVFSFLCLRGWQVLKGVDNILRSLWHCFRLFDQNPDLLPLSNYTWQRSRFSKEDFTSLCPIHSDFTSLSPVHSVLLLQRLNCKFWGFGGYFPINPFIYFA